MVWQAIAANVSGILFFAYHNEFQSLRACDNPQGWADISTVAGELQVLMPALLAPPTDEIRIPQNVQATCRRVGDDIWLLATNPGETPQQAVFALPDGVREAVVTDCFDSAVSFTASGESELDLAPGASVALRVAL